MSLFKVLDIGSENLIPWSLLQAKKVVKILGTLK